MNPIEQLLDRKPVPAFCTHCDVSSELLPGWKHEERPVDEHGTIEHLWWAIYPVGGFRFAAGVSVKRNPGIDVHFNGRPVMTWKLRCLPSSSAIEGAAYNVGLAAIRMVGTDQDGESMITQWAARLKRQPKQRRYLPAADEPIPF